MVSLWAFPCASGWCCCWSKDHTVCVLGHCYARLFCDPMDWGLQGSSVFGTSQARILEWLPFRTPGNLPDQRSNPCLCVSCIGRQILYHYTTWKTPRTILWGEELPTLVYYIPYLLACLKLVSIKAIGTRIKHSFSSIVLNLEFTFLCFYWIIIDLQCCVSLRYTTKWVTFWYQRKGTSIFSQGLKVSGYICFKKTLSCLVSQLKCFIFISSFRL